MTRSAAGGLWLCVSIGLTACGSGAGGGPEVSETVVGKDKSQGAISAFASVIVNGTEFQIDNHTLVTLDGQPSTEDDLKIGFVVLIEAQAGELVADSIEFSEMVLGEVESIRVTRFDAQEATLVVLRQAVIADSLSNLDGVALPGQNPPAPNEIAVGDVVVVAGTRNGDGEIAATYIGAPSAVGCV